MVSLGEEAASLVLAKFNEVPDWMYGPEGLHTARTRLG